MYSKPLRALVILFLTAALANAVDDPPAAPKKEQSASPKLERNPKLERIKVRTDDVVREFWIRRDEIGIEFQSAEVAARFRPVITVGKLGLTLRQQKSSQVFGGVRIYTIDGPPRNQLTRQRLGIELSRLRAIDSAGSVLLEAKSGRPNVLRNDLTVKFRPQTPYAAAVKTIRELGTKVVRRYGQDKQSFHVRLVDPSRSSLLDVLRAFQRKDHVRYVEFVYRITMAGSTAVGASSSCAQWHHENDGTGGKTEDADIDTPLAWPFTTGEKITAVIDSGFFATHANLSPNLWVNPDEIDGNGIDDDGNDKIDDIHGWDFATCLATFTDSNNHGTKVAGLLGSTGANPHGIMGSAPEGKIMLLAAQTNVEIVQAIDYAVDKGADVINMSFEPLNYSDYETAIERAVADGRDGKGCVITVAMKWSTSGNDCPLPHYQRLEALMVLVSFCTSKDEKHRPWPDPRAFGNCMSLMAPGKKIPTTTDEPNNGCGEHYTGSWAGTSAAAPIVAGVANLILSVRPTLEYEEVINLLQDTCDKIEPLIGDYSPVNGFSTPASGVSTHGFGRLNAYEAVRLVAPRVDGGRGGVDLVVRDNDLDWGNTEQPSFVRFEPTRDFIPYRESPDIKIDSGPGLQPSATTSEEFDLLSDEDPQPATDSRVFVRLRNRGPFTAHNVNVRLYAAPAISALPPFPERFWKGLPLLPNQTSDWQFVGHGIVSNLPYSGSSVAGSDADVSAVATFDWRVPPQAGAEYVLLALVECGQDPLAPFSSDLSHVAPRDNNTALRQIVIAP